MQIKCVILDDDTDNVDMIQSVIDTIIDTEVVGTFKHPEEFITHIRAQNDQLGFDFCILDYNLPDKTGLQVMQDMDSMKCILTSPDSLPADEIFEIENVIDAVRITKPINKERLRNAIKRVRDEVLTEKGYVLFKISGGYYRRFELSEIAYIKKASNSRKFEIYTITDPGPIETSNDVYDIDSVKQKLPKELFIQISESTLFNLDFFISEAKGNELIIDYPQGNKEKISLPYYKEYEKSIYKALGINRKKS